MTRPARLVRHTLLADRPDKPDVRPAPSAPAGRRGRSLLRSIPEFAAAPRPEVAAPYGREPRGCRTPLESDRAAPHLRAGASRSLRERVIAPPRALVPGC